MFIIEALHHVSIPVADLERAKQFYNEILGLTEITRPPFDFPGAWYQEGDRQLHLIVHDESTFREKNLSILAIPILRSGSTVTGKPETSCAPKVFIQRPTMSSRK